MSLWVDSLVKECWTVYNTEKDTASSRLRMQAVRKDSKDQEASHYNIQDQAGG